MSNMSPPGEDGLEPSPDPSRQAEARRYACAHRRFALGDLLLAGTLLTVLVFTGLSSVLAALITLPAVPAAIIYFVFLMIGYGILSAPLDYFGGYVLSHRYGLSTQGLGGWLGDVAKSTLLGLLLGSGMVALTYWSITAFPALWWLLTWAAVTLLTVVLTNLAPLVIVPLFFKTRPLADTDLKQRLEQLAERARTKVKGIYTIEFSRKVTTANAALMGLGNTRRIMLSDTLLQKYTPPEIEVITAHELGHHVHSDVLRLLVTQSAVLLLGFYFANLVFRGSVAWLGLGGISDVAALPLLLLIFAAFSLLAMPLMNAYSRHVETAADGYALGLTDDPQAFSSAMTKLTDQNLGEAKPARWVELLLYDHPAYYRRVELTRYYQAHRREIGRK
ncbi:MAG: M48 family metallopeptidase [Chloroflexi bacterium]|nr:M48 family metallopeptidase [Chloroflexota bacterium]